MVELLSEDQEESGESPVLVRTYGSYWNPDLVDWTNSWRLLGKRNKGSRSQDINVYEERGVYVLYKNYEPVYVGKAFKQSIGFRLQLHRESHTRGPRWDTFSWFGLVGLDKKNNVRNLRKRFSVDSTELIATLEALLISVIDPKLNARREKLKGAIHLFQSETDKQEDLVTRLASIEEKIDSLTSRNEIPAG